MFLHMCDKFETHQRAGRRYNSADLCEWRSGSPRLRNGILDAAGMDVLVVQTKPQHAYGLPEIFRNRERRNRFMQEEAVLACWTSPQHGTCTVFPN